MTIITHDLAIRLTQYEAIPDPVRWYDATSSSSMSKDSSGANTMIAVNNNDPVAIWYSELQPEVGNASFRYDIDNSTENWDYQLPTYHTNVQNGLPVVRFNGTDQALAQTTEYAAVIAPPSSYHHLFMVLKLVQSSTNGTIIGMGETTHPPWDSYAGYSFGNDYALHAGDGVRYSKGLPNTSNGIIQTGNTDNAGGDLTSAFHVVELKIGYPTINDVQIWVDHQLVGSGYNDDTTEIDPDYLRLGVGAGWAYTPSHMDWQPMDVGEILMYQRQLSQPESSSIHKYLMKKWTPLVPFTWEY